MEFYSRQNNNNMVKFFSVWSIFVMVRVRKCFLKRSKVELKFFVWSNIMVNTVFIRIVAAATINFSVAGVRLLIEGGSYSRTAFICFGGIPLHRSGGILL